MVRSPRGQRDTSSSGARGDASGGKGARPVVPERSTSTRPTQRGVLPVVLTCHDRPMRRREPDDTGRIAILGMLFGAGQFLIALWNSDRASKVSMTAMLGVGTSVVLVIVFALWWPLIRALLLNALTRLHMVSRAVGRITAVAFAATLAISMLVCAVAGVVLLGREAVHDVSRWLDRRKIEEFQQRSGAASWFAAKAATPTLCASEAPCGLRLPLRGGALHDDALRAGRLGWGTSQPQLVPGRPDRLRELRTASPEVLAQRAP